MNSCCDSTAKETAVSQANAEGLHVTKRPKSEGIGNVPIAFQQLKNWEGYE